MKSNMRYLRLYLAVGALYLADQLILFLVPLLIFSRTRDVSISTWVYAVEWAVRIVAGLGAPKLIQRAGAARTVMLSELARCMIALVLIAIMASPTNALSTIILTFIGPFFALLNSVATVAINTHLPQTIPAGRFAEVDARVATLDQFSMILGPALAGALWDWIPHAGVAIFAASLLATATILFRLISHENRTPEPVPSPLEPAGIREAHSWVWRSDPWLRRCLITAIFVNGLVGCAEALAPYALTQRLSQPGSWLGAGSWFGMMNTVSGVLSALLLTRTSRWIQHFGDITIWRATHMGVLVAALGLGRSDGPIVWVGSFSVLIASAVIGGVGYRTYRARTVPSEQLPGIVSYMWSIGQLGSVLSAALAGWIARTGDSFFTFYLLSGLFLMWTAWVYMVRGKAKTRGEAELREVRANHSMGSS